jgi:hypothetical protein
LKNINILNSQNQFLKSSENPNATIAKKNHKYMPLSGQGKAGSGNQDPNMMIGGSNN